MDFGKSTRATVPLRRRIMLLYSFVLRLLECAKYIMFVTSIEMHKTGKTLLVLIIGLPALRQWKKIRWKDRPELYDLMYSLRWGDAVTNNYGFAPAETDEPERFQLQLYAELIKLLAASIGELVAKGVLEISCGRGGGFRHLIGLLPVQPHAIGLDFSINAIRYCTHRYKEHPNVAFVCGHALRLPFRDMSFDVVVNVEASHAYRDDSAFLREVSRVLVRGGKFLYADYRRRYNVPTLERLARDTGFSGTFHDITANVVAACRLDAGRRQALIRAAVPWYYRVLANERLKRYAAIPGTLNFERFQGGDRLYFMTCLTRLR
jgi:ubiquinone/menaquinone biosynthesis C-methylase UbiE